MRVPCTTPCLSPEPSIMHQPCIISSIPSPYSPLHGLNHSFSTQCFLSVQVKMSEAELPVAGRRKGYWVLPTLTKISCCDVHSCTTGSYNNLLSVSLLSGLYQNLVTTICIPSDLNMWPISAKKKAFFGCFNSLTGNSQFSVYQEVTDILLMNLFWQLSLFWLHATG